MLNLFDGQSATLWYAPDADDDHAAALEIATGTAIVRRAPLSRRSVDRLMRLGISNGRIQNTGAADVAWSPDFTLPAVRGASRAITIHDLAWITSPESAPPGLRSYLDAVVPRQIESADAIFVVSESTRQRLLERYDVGSRPVVVAPNGVDARFVAAGQTPDRSSLEILNLPESYLLMVGTIEPRKNYVRVIDAVLACRPGLPLVIAGGRGWADEPVIRAIDRASERGMVQYLGYVPDDVLPQLYANARGLIAASVEEGFDLPVLEGMAAGLPLLLSDIAVHREVAGASVTFFDPFDVYSIEDGMMELLSNDERTRSDDDRQQALLRYSWDASASTIWETLKALA